MFGDLRRRIRRVPPGQRGLNFLPHGFVGDEFGQQRGGLFRRGFFLFEQFSRAGFLKRLRIEKLVVVRRCRQRHEQRRQPHRRHFGQGRRAGAAHGGGGGTQRQVHFREERFDDRLDAVGGVSGFYDFKILGAGEVKPLPVAVFEQWQRG